MYLPGGTFKDLSGKTDFGPCANGYTALQSLS